MKPNTPHAVFTPEHSIALGGHFYLFRNLQHTIFGIYHCFVVDNIITNTEHPEARVLLFRMMEYLYKFYVRGADPKSKCFAFFYKCFADVGLENNAQHLPDVTHFRSLVDIFALCNFCVLANVLDFNTYQFPLSRGGKPSPHDIRLRTQYDYNALTPVQRRYFTYIRGLALNFIFWMDCNYTLVKPNSQRSIVEIWVVYLTQQAYSLLNYKRRAEEQSVRGIINCKAAEVKRQLEYVLCENAWVKGIDFDQDLTDYDCFSFEFYYWEVKKLTEPFAFNGKPLLPFHPVKTLSYPHRRELTL